MLGHEITGEVIEAGKDVETLELGDIVSVPFNVACGRCRLCKERQTGVCLRVNESRPGGAYGYVDMGGWVGVMARVQRVAGQYAGRQRDQHGFSAPHHGGSDAVPAGLLGLVIGLVGGAIPALAAAGLPLTAALRARG